MARGIAEQNALHRLHSLIGYETEQTEKLHAIEARLRGTNVPTLEQALVVPAARLKRPNI